MGRPNDPRLRRIRRRSRLADFVLDVLDGYGRHRTGRNASLLAYMGLLTVFPLLLVATTVLGLYRADSRPELDRLLRALPLYAWMKITVTPLGAHPNDPATASATALRS